MSRIGSWLFPQTGQPQLFVNDWVQEIHVLHPNEAWAGDGHGASTTKLAASGQLFPISVFFPGFNGIGMPVDAYCL